VQRKYTSPTPPEANVLPQNLPESFLPLRPVELQVLLSLLPGPKHGYGMIQDAADRTGRAAIPDVGTLYRALRRMVDLGLIEALDETAEGTQRKEYGITPLGLEVARAESRRLTELLETARSHGLLEPAREG
jgi:DNA-binding PadR family transcriptional regulator